MKPSFFFFKLEVYMVKKTMITSTVRGNALIHTKGPAILLTIASCIVQTQHSEKCHLVLVIS